MSHWIITSKPSFHDEWLLLSKHDSQQVLESIRLLAHDPRPDGKTSKMQRPHLQGMLHTIRTRNYRLSYTFEHPHIRLLALRPAGTSLDETELERLAREATASLDEVDTPQQEINWDTLLGEPSREPCFLPEPITMEMLARLRVPRQHHARLLTVRTREALLNCRGVPHDITERIEGILWKKPLAQIAGQPNHVIEQIEDLERYKDGDLLSFLLQLSPEQSEPSTQVGQHQ